MLIKSIYHFISVRYKMRNGILNIRRIYKMSLNQREIIRWEYIKDICNICDETQGDLEGDLLNNNRRPEVNIAYEKWKQEGKKKTLVATIFGQTKSPVVVRLNDFPYNFEDNIVHYVVWLRPHQTVYDFEPRMTQELSDWVNQEIKMKEENNIIEVIHFRNSPELRTIDTINHYHALARIGQNKSK